MTEGTCTDSRPVCLLPITMTGPITPPLGDWHGLGLCVGEDPDIFFPAHGDPGTKAREMCAACTVLRDCLGYAMKADGSSDAEKQGT
jgi:Transcription factor WhiB